MEETNFSDGEVAEILEKRFVACAFDIFEPEGERYEIEGTPTTVVLTPAGERIGVDLDFADAKQYKAALISLEQNYARLKSAMAAASSADASRMVELGKAYGSLSMGGPAVKAFEKAVAAYEKRGERRLAAEAQSYAGAELLKSHDSAAQALVGAADRLERLDSDGKLGYRDDALFLRARADWTDGKMDDSFEKFGLLLKEHPNSNWAEDSLYGRALYLFQVKQDNTAAAAAMREFIEKHPESPRRPTVEHLLRHAVGDPHED